MKTIVLKNGLYGKPFVCGSVHFNASASTQHWIIAFTENDPIGIDVEDWNPGRSHAHIEDLVKRFFNDREYHAMMRMNADQKASYFYHLWTAKEAFMKLIGTGLYFGLDRITLCPFGVFSDVTCTHNAQCPDVFGFRLVHEQSVPHHSFNHRVTSWNGMGFRVPLNVSNCTASCAVWNNNQKSVCVQHFNAQHAFNLLDSIQ